MDKRHFTVLSVVDRYGHHKGEENVGGRFKGTPMSVAKKAGSKVCRNTKIRGQCTFFVTMREVTRGSANKIYIYKIKRVRLPHPKEILRLETNIVYKYRILASRVEEAPIYKTEKHR